MTGRTILITGDSDGVGAAVADRLARSGENVVVIGRSPEKTAAVAAATVKAYGTARLENILFIWEPHRRCHAAGISTAAFHPGNVASNFASEANSRIMALAYRTPVRYLAMVGLERGAGPETLGSQPGHDAIEERAMTETVDAGPRQISRRARVGPCRGTVRDRRRPPTPSGARRFGHRPRQHQGPRETRSWSEILDEGADGGCAVLDRQHRDGTRNCVTATHEAER